MTISITLARILIGEIGEGNSVTIFPRNLEGTSLRLMANRINGKDRVDTVVRFPSWQEEKAQNANKSQPPFYQSSEG